jgi:lysozyme
VVLPVPLHCKTLVTQNLARKKKNSFRNIFLFILFLVGLFAAVLYINKYVSGPKFVRYPGFGIDIPEQYQIHGIDVSRHQSTINWTDVKAMQIKKVKIGFAFIKATEGLGSVDEEFRNNWRQCGRSGLPRGAYHFFIASKSGKAQAENFIETVRFQKGDLPPVLDIETTNGASVEDIKQRAKDWLLRVEQYYKVKPVIYTNVGFYNSFLGADFDGYPLWIAHYLQKDKPRIGRNWSFWQHNETGHVNGIDAYVDFNVFNGDSVQFRKMLFR